MKIKTGFVIVVFLSLIAFAGCTNPQNDSSNESEVLVLKSYKVPERFAHEISETINSLLYRDADKPENSQTIGKARIAPDGQLLVAAPKSFHDGLKDFIASVANTKPEPSLSTVNYWIVAGRKAKTRAKLDEFTGIQPALDTIQNNQGNMEFKLLDHVVTTSSGQGTKSHVKGSLSLITQSLTAESEGTLVIMANIRTKGRSWGDFNTQIEIKSGELVVLGQVNQEFNMPIFTPAEEGKPHDETVSVFYIISAAVKK